MKVLTENIEETSTIEPKFDKIIVDDLEIIVRGKKQKPYYEIMYHVVGDKPDSYNIGFGSYYLNNVFDWKEKYFNIITKDNT